jgi:hypothetical protein
MIYSKIDFSNDEMAGLHFPDLSVLQKGDSVPETIYNLFLTGSGETRIDGHYFERTVTPLKQNDKIKGYFPGSRNE